MVDTVKPDPIHGAGVLLFDENLDPVSIRMFNEVSEWQEWTVHVDEPIETSLPQTEFYKNVEELVNGSGPWESFRASLDESMNALRNRLGARVRC